VLEVAENNRGALTFYRKRSFYKLDAALFLAKRVPNESEILPPRKLPRSRARSQSAATPSKVPAKGGGPT
jgi:hypothetical protein